MEAIAKLTNVTVSPRKMRLLVRDLKGKMAADVIARLGFVRKAAVGPIIGALKSAVANAKLPAEKLLIKNIIVNEGMKMKRGAKGRNAKTDRGVVQKRRSHIKIILEERSEVRNPKSEV